MVPGLRSAHAGRLDRRPVKGPYGQHGKTSGETTISFLQELHSPRRMMFLQMVSEVLALVTKTLQKRIEPWVATDASCT